MEERMIQIFYHEKDLDGWASGAITHYYFEKLTEKKVELIPYDYHKEYKLPSMLNEEAESIYFVDCSADPNYLEEVDREYNNIFVLDHHKSFIEKIDGYSFKGRQEIGIAGCQIVWNFFFPKENEPVFISLLGIYDIWDNEDRTYWNENVMPFQMGMRLRATEPNTISGFSFWREKIDNYFENKKNEISISWETSIIKEGRVILEYQRNEDRKVVKLNSFEGTFEGYNIIALNNTRTNSQVFDSVWDPERHDIMFMWYNVGGEKYIVSLYTKKDDMDVSLIAKDFGGGGHKQAAGFVCRDVIIDENKGITIV